MQAVLKRPSLWQAAEAFVKKNTVMVIALFAAAVTSVIVPVEGKYIGYFDFKTRT